MTLTEADAKTKWCPFTRGVAGGPSDGSCATCNRFPVGSSAHADTLCIGSACMAWRAALTPDAERAAEAEFRKSGRRLAESSGYCGLAGKP